MPNPNPPQNTPKTYRIVVPTGDVPDAGTDSNIYLTMYGEFGTNGERLLDNSDNNFERDKTDVFQLETRNVGKINAVRIRSDDAGDNSGWFLDKIIITDDAEAKEYTFPCNRWLATDEDDHSLERVLYPALVTDAARKPT
jgi:hypothetical protein